MRFSSQEGGFGPRRDIRLAEDPGEVLQILKNSGMAPDSAGFYADFCIRRNHGRLQVYLLYEKGAPVSTAGFYSLGEQEGYLSCVATMPGSRGRGYATALCAHAARQAGQREVLLTCREEMEPVYAKAGFVPAGLTHRFIKKERIHDSGIF